MLFHIVVTVLGVRAVEDRFPDFINNLSIHSFLNFGLEELVQDFEKDAEINKFTLRFVLLLSDKLLNKPEIIMGNTDDPTMKFDRRGLLYVELVFNMMGVSRLRRDLLNKSINLQDMGSFKLNEFFDDQDIMKKEIKYADKDLIAYVKDKRINFDKVEIGGRLYKLRIDNVNTDFKNKTNRMLGYPYKGSYFSYHMEMNNGGTFTEYTLTSDIMIENYNYLINIISNKEEVGKEEHAKHIKILLMLCIIFLCILVTIAILSVVYWIKNKKENYVYLGEGL